MFMLTMGTGMDQGFPDVCLTPATVPVPTPYPNIAMSSNTAPVVDTILINCMPVINQLSKGFVSNGDEAGTLGGVASHMIDGMTLYQKGCSAIYVGGAPAQRLTSVTAQNAIGTTSNAPGMCLAPSQTTVLASA